MSTGNTENRVRVPVFFAKPHHASYESVLPKLKREEGILLIETGSIVELVPRIKKIGFGVIVLHTPTQDHLIKAITFLRLNQEALIKGFIKVIVCTPFGQRAVVSTLEKYGVADIITPPFNWRTIDLKVKRWVGTLESRLDLLRDKGGKSRGKRRQSAQGGLMERKEGTVHFVKPIDHPSDVWIIERKKPRKMMGRWSAQLLGPPPNQGRWVALDSDLRTVEKWWKWVPNQGEDDLYIQNGTAWFLWGQRPEFRSNTWQFLGQQIQLVLRAGDEEIAKKIAMDQKGDLIVARDSELAISRIPIFQKLLRDLVRSGKPMQAQVVEKSKVSEEGTESHTEELELGREPSEDQFLETKYSKVDYETSEWKGHSIRVGKTDEGIPLFVIPANVFSEQPGVWEDAGTVGPSETAYLFVDQEGKRLAGYFMFSGKIAPEYIEAEDAWAFEGREPEWTANEVELPRFFKQYLEQRGDAPPVMPSKERSIEELEGVEDEVSSKVDVPQEDAPHSEINDNYAHSDVELSAEEERLFRQISGGEEGHIYEGEIHGDPENENPGAALEISEDQTPWKEHDLSESRPRDAVLETEIAHAAEEQVLHTLERDEMKDITKVLTHGASKEAARKLRSENPSEPSLSILAMGYLVSELMIKRSLHPSALITRYLEFLKNSCGGLNVEMWAKRGRSFVRIGSSASTTLDQKTVMPLLDDVVDGQCHTSKDVIAVPIRRKDELLGAVILYGEGATKVPEDYLLQNALFCVGFCVA